MDRAQYLSGLINSPWTREGRNCWRLVREVERDLFGRDVPAVITAAPAGRRERIRLLRGHEENARWREVGAPIDGAIVKLRRRAARPDDFDHAGVFLALDGGGVLHTDAPHGVVFDNFTELAARGWAPSFFVPAG